MNVSLIMNKPALRLRLPSPSVPVTSYHSEAEPRPVSSLLIRCSSFMNGGGGGDRALHPRGVAVEWELIDEWKRGHHGGVSIASTKKNSFMR